MTNRKTLIEHLLILRDQAPAQLAASANPEPDAGVKAARFYAAVYAALPTLVEDLITPTPAPPPELDIVQFRRVRQLVRAAQAWHTRTPGGEPDLERALDAAVAAWHARAGDDDNV